MEPNNQQPQAQPAVTPQVITPTNNTVTAQPINAQNQQSDPTPQVFSPNNGAVPSQPSTPPAQQAAVSSTEPLQQNQPSPIQPAANDNPKNPGKTLAIISLVLPFLSLSAVGLVLAIIAKVKSKKAGFKNTLATVSIVLNTLFVLISLALMALFVLALPLIQARSVAVAFNNSITEGNYDTALSYTANPEQDAEVTKSYFAYLKESIGTGYTETASSNKDGTYGFVYTTSDGSTYYRIVVSDNKVVDAVVSKTELQP